MRSALSRRAVVAALLLGFANASCAATTVMFTDYERRTPSQYRLLWVDLAVVGAAAGVGAPLYALSDERSVGESVGLGLLIGSGVWAAYTLMTVALLGMPSHPVSGGVIMARAPRAFRAAVSGGRRATWTDARESQAP